MAPDARPADLLVIAATRPWTCAECSTEFDRGSFLTMEDAGPVCTVCADLVHLEFLPRGDAALTRRARGQSRLSAVVVRWSRSRRRYERQGILAETDAIEQAERECLADAAARERRRQREVLRRVEQDERFVADLTEAIRARFPGCPADRAARIARHAGERSSGRIGRTRAGRALEAHAVGDLRRHRLQLGPEPGPLHGTAATLGRSHHHPHHVGRDREADADRAARAREDRGVDAGQPSGEVDQCAAGIARIDGGVGLNEELIIGDADLGARQRRDDTVRHRLPDAKRIADGEHDVAHLQRVGIGEVEERKALVAVLDAQHREIAALILQHQSGFELALVGERDLHLVGAFDDVIVGDDQSGGIDQHAGAERALQLAAGAIRYAEKAAEDRIVEQRVAILHRLGGVDIDHRRRHPLHHRRIGQPQFGGGRHAPLLGRGALGGRRGKTGPGDGGDQNGGQLGLAAHAVESRQ